MQKDTKRYRKMGIDGSLIGECGFSCVASAHVLLNRMFPYLCGGEGVESYNHFCVRDCELREVSCGEDKY